MNADLANIVLILALAMAVAIAARRLHLPYTVGLVLVGAGIAAFRGRFGVSLTHELIFDFLLPPFLFEAALNLRWRELRADLAPIFVLSTIGTVVAAGVVAAMMVLLLAWPPQAAVVFGALIAATDPVAVIATFKDHRVEGRLRLLVESESLFNDGVAAVLFAAALGWATSGDATPSFAGLIESMGLSIAGGIGVGALVAALAILAAGRTSEHLVEAALTTVAAYGAFLIAERLHVSGVLATVTAGLLMGNVGALDEEDKPRHGFTNEGRAFTLSFWEFVAFLANSFLFPLIGQSVGAIALASPLSLSILAAIPIALVGRAATVYPLSLPFARSRWRLPMREQHVLWWGGLRGALGLALALSLPDSLPLHDEILVATFVVAAFSIVLQGLTMPLLLRSAGVTGKAPR